MVKKLISLCLVVASAALMSCGGSSNTITGGGGGGASDAAVVQVLASNPVLLTDQTGLTSIDIIATVKDANNVLLADAPVTFGTSDAGVSISVVNSTTDSSGQAIARLASGSNLAERQITVTATSGTASGNVVVSLSGNTIDIDCPDTIALGANGLCNINVQDGKSLGIQGVTLAISSQNGNSLSAASLTTGNGGSTSVTVTATQAGTDTILGSALGTSGVSGGIDVPAVSGDSFSVTAPASDGLEINLNTDQSISATWLVGGAPQAAQAIQFTSTRGVFTPANGIANTDGAGVATVTVRSSNSGPAIITATRPGGGQAIRAVEFVATTASTIDLQAEPFTVRVGQETQLTATVRDPTGNPVKNKFISFQILADTTGGSVSPAQVKTDSLGRATSIYTAGDQASAVNGVQLRATVLDTPAVTDTVNLTVSGQALAISLGTGNELFEIGTATFAKEWVVFVTDADGNAVTNKQVQVSLRSVNYRKGNLFVPDPGGDSWQYESLAICADEDANLNGILDVEDLNNNGILDPGEDTNNNGLLEDEDFNNSGLIEAGNIALVAAVPASAPAGSPCTSAGSQGQAANVVTDSQGKARVCVFYPQSYNLWVDARIQAKASVQGTEFSKSQTFLLQALAQDINNVNADPPGVVSPFGLAPTGTNADCSIAPPP